MTVMRSLVRGPSSTLFNGATFILPAILLVVAGCSSSATNSTESDGGTDGGPASGSGSGSGTASGSGSSGGTAAGSGSSGGAASGSGSSGGAASGSGSSGGTAGGSGSGGGTASGSGSSGGTASGGGSGDAGGDAGTGTSCTMANATCVSDNQACNVGSTYDLYDNQWNCKGNNCGPESAYGCLNGDGTVDFVVNSNQPAGNTAVLTYPAMQLNFPSSNPPTLSSLKSVTSTFTVVPPTGSNNDWEVAYDLWFNPNNANEFMVWVYNNGQTPGGKQVATNVSLGGKTYDIWWSNNGGTDGTVYFVLTTNIKTGTLDLLQLFQYAAQHGWLPADSTVDQFDFGTEVCSTNGKNATWTFTNYSMTTTM
jgi:Glycosyl hydrolase family 12